MNTAWIAVASLFPLVTGPLPVSHEVITVSLCSGGMIEIPLRNSDREPRDRCIDKGCHAACPRRRFDPPQ